MEITELLKSDPERAAEIDMHSVINLVSVISSQLQMLMGDSECEPINSLLKQNRHMLEAIKTQDKEVLSLQKIYLYGDALLALPGILAESDCRIDDQDLAFYRESISDIVKVMRVRFKEVWQKWENPTEWLVYDIDQFKYDFSRFFGAMEKNSRGRYRIVKNIAAVTDGQDYLLNFEVDSIFKPRLFMPLSVKDVIRDLAANARKYTEPGGTIDIGIMQTETMLRVVVRDSGIGIPKDELHRVVEFGYRASNVKTKIRTMGGGFGLTKACTVVLAFGGRIWIESEEGEGTAVKIELPLPSTQHIQNYKLNT
ncbi:MAG: ATP-binding protein [Balneolales bacterium]|nr:ATP-binding protein [Balneolales bacterium]